MEDIYLDRVFIGVTGLDAERGATMQESDEALLFRKIQEHSKHTTVVADRSKLGKVSPALICPASKIHLIITDTGASDEAIQPFIDRGCKVMRV